MIVNSFVTGLVSIFAGYALGSIPTAYLVTRWKTGKDIRKLGGGNVGGLNTFKEVGLLPAVIVTVVDLGKGAATVAITRYVLHLEETYVLISATGAVMGHNWMPWLKFTGGKGMGAAIGSLFVIMTTYGYLKELWIFLAIIIVPLLATRNVALSMGIGLCALPFIGWLSIHSGLFVTWSVVTGLVIAAKFAPTALAAMAKSTNLWDFIKGH